MNGAQAKELGERIDAHLRSMPHSEYLVTITAICEAIKDAYRPFLSDADTRLMTRTLILLRSCSHSDSTDNVNEAQRLWDDWSTTLDEPEEDGSEGWFAAVYTFRNHGTFRCRRPVGPALYGKLGPFQPVGANGSRPPANGGEREHQPVALLAGVSRC
jgi:hypothetical protein